MPANVVTGPILLAYQNKTLFLRLLTLNDKKNLTIVANH
jgi:hypothetical protein